MHLFLCFFTELAKVRSLDFYSFHSFRNFHSFRSFHYFYNFRSFHFLHDYILPPSNFLFETSPNVTLKNTL